MAMIRMTKGAKFDRLFIRVGLFYLEEAPALNTGTSTLNSSHCTVYAPPPWTFYYDDNKQPWTVAHQLSHVELSIPSSLEEVEEANNGGNKGENNPAQVRSVISATNTSDTE